MGVVVECVLKNIYTHPPMRMVRQREMINHKKRGHAGDARHLRTNVQGVARRGGIGGDGGGGEEVFERTLCVSHLMILVGVVIAINIGDDGDKVVPADEAVTRRVCEIHHCCNIFLGKLFAEMFHHTTEFLG